MLDRLRAICVSEFAIAFLAIGVFIGALMLSESVTLSLAICCAVPVFVILCLNPVCLVYAFVIYFFTVKFLIGDLGIPAIANYVCDGLLLVMLLFALISPKRVYRPNAGLRKLGYALLAFWLVATASALINGVNFILYMWACRSVFRLFGFLFVCVRLLGPQDVRRLVGFIEIFFWINLFVSSFQYFFLGTGQDNTNGLFGTGSGGNAMINVLLFFMSGISLFGFLGGKRSLARVVFALAACCYLAAIAEIKVFYVELVLLVCLTVIMRKPSFKTVVVVMLALVTLFAGTQALIAFNPGFANYFSLERIIESSSTGGYSNADNLNRLTAVSELDFRFMGDPLSRLLGLGFGAGQYTQFFESPLYAVWGDTLNWNWFTDAAVFLETGYIGLTLYCACIALVALQAVLLQRKAGGDGWIVAACAAIGVLCLLLIVYNGTLTVDPGCYFIGLLLAFPYILSERDSTQTDVNVGGSR